MCSPVSSRRRLVAFSYPSLVYTFRPRHRLRHAREFQAVYGSRLRKNKGPLVLFARPNELDHPRLGLSVGKAAGPATVRNRIKRLIRESFRLLQHDLPRWNDDTGRVRSYDFIVNVRRHDLLPLHDYQRLLSELADAAHRTSQRRRTP
jgi:ribonuclease P protein component